MLKYIIGNQCYICNNTLNTENLICNNCLDKLVHIPEINFIESNDNFYFNKVYSILENNDALKNIIHLYKFNNIRSFSLLLSNLILKRYSLEFFNNYDFIVPVPLHNKKLRKRGFNQTTKILENIVDKNHIFMDVFKTKNTKQQSLVKSRKEREENLKNIFEINDDKIALIKNKNILLFDDIFTTGSTLNSMAKPFFYSMASRIDVLTIGVS
jgi:competence protein ComFC